MPHKYNIIYADPPWRYRDRKPPSGGCEEHYNTMSLEELSILPIDEISADNSILFMWATWPLIKEALQLIESWGFEYKTCAFVWVKTNKGETKRQASLLPLDDNHLFMGLGRWARGNTEFVLLATKGRVKRVSASVRQVILAPLRRHSQKPDEVRDRIVELVGDLPRLELFARENSEGWDAFGNEIEDSINFDALLSRELEA